MQTIKASVVVALTICVASVASATVTMQDVQITNPNGSGNVMNQLLVDFDNQLGTSQLRLVLSAGTILGTDLASNPVTPKPPITASDNVTFIALGGDTFTSGLNSTALTPGASSGLGGPGGALVFNDNALDIAWAPNPPVPVDGQDFLVAQIVLSPDAQGEWNVEFTSGDGNNFLMRGLPIFGGVLIPEPSTIGLALLGLCGVVGMARRHK